MSNFNFRKSFILLFTSLFLILLLAACGSDDSTKEKETGNGTDSTSTESSEPIEGGKLSIGVSQEPDTLDLHKTGMIIASNIGDLIGGALLELNPDTLEIEPYLAEDYTVSDDGQTITFDIRSGVTLHDGTELTAQVFKETFERALDPETASPGTGSMLATVEEITAPDDSTLVLQLKEPSAPILNSLTSGSYLQPMSMAAIEEFGDDYGKNPVGVGPWKFSEWRTGQSVTLVRNEDFAWANSYYENQGAPYPEELEFKFIEDYQTRLNALETGSIDIAMDIDAKDVDRFRNNDSFIVEETERQGIGLYVQINSAHDILQDVNVRKALNMAIDKEVIIQGAINGEGVVAHGPIPSSILGYDTNIEDYAYNYDVDEAISLLEASGWQLNSQGIMEKDGKTLSFELLSTSEHDQSAQIVQAMFKDIGVEINIQTMESATLLEKTSDGDYDIAFSGYVYNDPDVLYLFFHSSQIGGLNRGFVENPELDDLVEKGRQAMDVDERAGYYEEAQKIIVEEAYWVPIYTDNVFYVINERVKDVKVRRAPNGLLFHDSWVEQ